jgi:hypothetical protein
VSDGRVLPAQADRVPNGHGTGGLKHGEVVAARTLQGHGHDVTGRAVDDDLVRRVRLLADAVQIGTDQEVRVLHGAMTELVAGEAGRRRRRWWPIPWSSASVALVGAVRFRKNASSSLDRASPMTSTGTVWLVVPGAKLSVPDAGRNRGLRRRVPSPVAYETPAVKADGPESDTVKVHGVVPELPSTTAQSLTETEGGGSLSDDGGGGRPVRDGGVDGSTTGSR